MLLNDGTVKIFLNPNSKLNDVSDDLIALLNYIVGIKSNNPLVETLDDSVQVIKRSRELRNDRMRWEEEIRAQAHWAAVAAAEEAKKENTIKIIKNFFAEGASIELIQKATGWTEDQIRELVSN